MRWSEEERRSQYAEEFLWKKTSRLLKNLQ